MKRVFADSWFFIALVDARDAHHERVLRYSAENEPNLVTTRWILAEVANTLSEPPIRTLAVNLLRQLETEDTTHVVRESDSLFERGLDLSARRPDKSWSHTDCISFLVMRDEGLAEALTGDHHFAQAGFIPVFAEPT